VYFEGNAYAFTTLTETKRKVVVLHQTQSMHPGVRESLRGPWKADQENQL